MRLIRLNGNDIVMRGKFTPEEKEFVRGKLKDIIGERFPDIPITTVGNDRRFFISQMIEMLKSRCFDFDDDYRDDLTALLKTEFGDFCVAYFIELTSNYLEKMKSQVLRGKSVRPVKKTLKLNVESMF